MSGVKRRRRRQTQNAAFKSKSCPCCTRICWRERLVSKVHQLTQKVRQATQVVFKCKPPSTVYVTDSVPCINQPWLSQRWVTMVPLDHVEAGWRLTGNGINHWALGQFFILRRQLLNSEQGSYRSDNTVVFKGALISGDFPPLEDRFLFCFFLFVCLILYALVCVL